MAARPFLCAAALALAACSSPEEMREETAAGDEAPAAAEATAAAQAAGGARALAKENEVYVFKLSWPEEVGAITALARRLEEGGEKAKAELAEQGEEDKKATEESGFPYNPHSYEEEWKVVAEVPGYLSLSKEFYSFTGGAHGNYGMESLVWDKAAGRGFAAVEMFASPAVLGAALGAKLCDALDAERLARRGPEYQPDADDPFGACPGIDEATVLVGSSGGRSFDRIGIYFGPYVAGPYAEGAFELDFPVDAKVLDAVKPEYRSAFSIRR